MSQLVPIPAFSSPQPRTRPALLARAAHPPAGKQDVHSQPQCLVIKTSIGVSIQRVGTKETACNSNGAGYSSDLEEDQDSQGRGNEKASRTLGCRSNPFFLVPLIFLKVTEPRSFPLTELRH